MGSLRFLAALHAFAARTLARALPALAATTACACGLASNGLLDVGDGAPDATGGGVADGFAGNLDGAGDGLVGDGGGAVDGFVSDRGGVVDGSVGDREGAVDGATAPTDGTTGADSDAAMVAPSDARAAESSTPPDGPSDGPLDAPTTPPPDSPADAPNDGPATGPSPIVWDGGTIADPQFNDSAWLDFCASLSACGEFPSLSACLAFMPQPASPEALIPPPALIDAVNAAAPNCANVGMALGDGSTCPSTTPDVCSGNSLVTCHFGFKMTIDCGSAGLVCSNGNGNAGCGFGDCSAAQEGATYCVGLNYVARCASGRYVADLDCQTFGTTCSGVAGSAQCRGMGKMTCTSGTTGCMGQTLDVCAGGSSLRVDCSALYDPSFSCVTSAAGAASCAADTACNPATFMDTCAGQGQVNICNAGATTQYDCTLNWNRCSGGHCVP